MNKNREQLINFGLKEGLVNKLTDIQINEILAFSMDHIGASNLIQMLIQLASMEVSGKYGAAYLASEGIASTIQLKNISAEEINEIISDYTIHQQLSLAIRAVKDKIIESQQEKFSGYEHGKFNTEAVFNYTNFKI